MDRDQIITRVETGVRRKRNGWQAYVYVPKPGGGYQQITRPFPHDAKLFDIRQWRHDQLALTTPAARGSLRADMFEYYGRVAAMPTIAAVKRDGESWIIALGADRSRQSVTAGEIETVMQSWLITPSVRQPGARGGRSSAPGGLAPATVCRRLSMLRAFYERMNGTRAGNPARDAVAPQIPKPEDRSIDLLTVDRILAQLSAVCFRSGAPSRAAICARVIASTALPPSILRAITASDVDLSDGCRVRVHARKKGGGTEPRTMDYRDFPDAIAAFQAFHDADCYGRVPQSSVLNVAFKRAAKAAGVDPSKVHLYDLRHSFLADVYRETHDQATVGRLGLHSPGSKHTARYTQGAHADVDAAAVRKLADARKARRATPDAPAPAGSRPVLQQRAKAAQ